MPQCELVPHSVDDADALRRRYGFLRDESRLRAPRSSHGRGLLLRRRGRAAARARIARAPAALDLDRRRCARRDELARAGRRCGPRRRRAARRAASCGSVSPDARAAPPLRWLHRARYARGRSARADREGPCTGWRSRRAVHDRQRGDGQPAVAGAQRGKLVDGDRAAVRVVPEPLLHVPRWPGGAGVAPRSVGRLCVWAARRDRRAVRAPGFRAAVRDRDDPGLHEAERGDRDRRSHRLDRQRQQQRTGRRRRCIRNRDDVGGVAGLAREELPAGANRQAHGLRGRGSRPARLQGDRRRLPGQGDQRRRRDAARHDELQKDRRRTST